jgi:hypothetical protein
MPFSTNSSDGEVINFTLERDYEIVSVRFSPLLLVWTEWSIWPTMAL